MAGNLKHAGANHNECKKCGKWFNQAVNLSKHENIHTLVKSRKFSQKNKSLSKRLESCKQNRAGGENADVRAIGFTNDLGTQRETGNTGVTDAQSVIIEKHSCWICQEEMSSEALLLQHYENHMTFVCVEDS